MNTTESFQEIFLLNKCALTEFTVIFCSLSVGIFIPEFNGRNLFESLDLNISSKCPQKASALNYESVQEIWSKSLYSPNKATEKKPYIVYNRGHRPIFTWIQSTRTLEKYWGRKSYIHIQPEERISCSPKVTFTTNVRYKHHDQCWLQAAHLTACPRITQLYLTKSVGVTKSV